MIEIGSTRSQQEPLNREVGTVSRAPIPEVNDSFYIFGGNGQMHSWTREVQKLWNQELDGEYQLRVVKALAATQRFYKGHGLKLGQFRATHFPGAHYATDDASQITDPPNIPGDFQLASWSQNQVPVNKKGPIYNPVKPELYTIRGFEGIHEEFYRDEACLANPFLSSKGYGAVMGLIITPGLRMGMRGLPTQQELENGEVYSYTMDMFGTSMLTKFASIWDHHPSIAPFSRQSIVRGTLRGYQSLQTTSPVQMFGSFTPISCPVDVAKEYTKDIPRDVNGVMKITELKSPIEGLAEKLTKRQQEYAAARRGACHPVSGFGLTRMIIQGVPPGNGGLTLMEQYKMVLEWIRNYCEEFCPEYRNVAKGSPEEKAWHEELLGKEEYCRIVQTFSVMLEWDNKNYGGFENLSDIPSDMPTWIIQIPFREMSAWGRRQMPIGPDGRPAILDADGKFMLPTVKDEWYTTRQIRNEPAGNGFFGFTGGGCKHIEADMPYDDVDLPWYEWYVCLNYANCRGDDEQHTYGYDSFQGPVQNAQPNNPANNRTQIQIICTSVPIAKDPSKALWEVQGPPRDIATNTPTFTYRDDNGQPIPYRRPFDTINSEPVWFRRDEKGKWPEYLKNSHYLNLFGAFNKAAEPARQIIWSDDNPGIGSEGWCILDSIPGGGDVEGHAVDCNAFMCGIWANWFDEMTKLYCKPGQRLRVMSPDHTRTWPTVDRLTDEQLLDHYRRIYPNFDQIISKEDFLSNPTIFRTYAPDVNFRFRFLVRVTIEEDPYYNVDGQKDSLPSVFLPTQGLDAVDLTPVQASWRQELLGKGSTAEQITAIKRIIAAAGGIDQMEEARLAMRMLIRTDPAFLHTRRALMNAAGDAPLN